MNSDETKLKEIKNILDCYISGFIGGDLAMSKINNILTRRYTEVTNMSLIDMQTREVIISVDSAVVSYKY